MPEDVSPTGAGDPIVPADARERSDDADDPSLRAEPQRVVEQVESAAALALAPLTAAGHHLLTVPSTEGDPSAAVDVLVGPTGVFLLATRAWRDVTVVDGRIYDRHAEVTAELDALVDLRLSAEADLAEIGLAPGEVRAVVVLDAGTGIDTWPSGVLVIGAQDVLAHVAGQGARLTRDQVSTVLARVVALFPSGRARGGVGEVVSATEEWPTGLHAVGSVESALLEAARRPPLAEWMTFLDPDQARLARRSFNGPARISGATGTGKTCVGLHRAAYLARTRPGTVLYTTQLRSLPLVLRQSLHRMAPEVTDRVEFSHVRALAGRVLRERGIRVNVDAAKAEAAMDRAWHDVGASGLLGESRHDRDYWREEIQYVIKGRGITSFVEYAGLARTGRRSPLTPEVRSAVWAMFEAYQAQLDGLGVHDDLDVIALADAALQREPQPDRFSAVIVDEAQDLTLTMVRMLRSFVGDARDGLTLIGDTQQTLCPGAFTLAEAGISLAGRGAVLTVNHRSTAQILGFASGFAIVPDAVDGLGSTEEATVATAARHGSEPVVERCSTEGERGERMVAWIRSLVSEARADAGDIAVLCVGAAGVAWAMNCLMRAGIPVIELGEYGNDARGAVRVGTIERAKGLEFGQVVMGDVVTSWFDGATTDEVERERRDRRRRDLYVGMSRARDGLWVGVA